MANTRYSAPMSGRHSHEA